MVSQLIVQKLQKVCQIVSKPP